MNDVFEPLKWVLGLRLDELAQKTPRELRASELALSHNVLQRSVADQAIERRQKLEQLLLNALKELMEPDEVPTKLTISYQSASKTKSDPNADVLINIEWGAPSGNRATFAMELPQPVGEALDHVRHIQRKSIAHAALPSHYALVVNALDAAGKFRSSVLEYEGRVRLGQALRPALMALILKLGESDPLRDALMKQGFYADDLIDAATKF